MARLRIRRREWTDAERIADVSAYLRKDREKKAKVAKAARTKVEKAQVKVAKARSKIQLEEARTKLRIAKTRRLIVEANTKAALVNAKIRLDNARAANVRASEAKWKARAVRIRSAASLAKNIVVGNGGSTRGKSRKKKKGYLEQQHDSLIDF